MMKRYTVPGSFNIDSYRGLQVDLIDVAEETAWSNMEAKALRLGVVYEVSTSSEGSAYGGGKFMITDERRVVNLPR